MPICFDWNLNRGTWTILDTMLTPTTVHTCLFWGEKKVRGLFSMEMLTNRSKWQYWHICHQCVSIWERFSSACCVANLIFLSVDCERLFSGFIDGFDPWRRKEVDCKHGISKFDRKNHITLRWVHYWNLHARGTKCWSEFRLRVHTLSDCDWEIAKDIVN